MTDSNARKIYSLCGTEALLTAQPDLRQYLTGISTSFGYVITDKNGTSFYTDSRYIEGAKKALGGSGIKVELFKSPLTDYLKGYKEVAVPLSRITYPEYKRLCDANLKVMDSEKAFQTVMAIKQDYEIEAVKSACKITDEAFLALLPEIKEGISENDVAAELEYKMRKLGASGTSFSTIVAFGENTSVPHHETGNRKLKYGESVLIDFGCVKDGYCSDCTRTFLFGDNKDEEFKKVYNHVLKAHMLVKEQTREGMTGKQADAIARDYLKEYGLDIYFTHSLGHGIGINVHEFPAVSPRSEDILQNGMIFSDEPGVYFEGKFGIRIEDTITLQNGKVISLTDTDKNLIIL